MNALFGLPQTWLLCCRMKDVGKPKAEVAAERIQSRVTGVQVTPHFCRIEDKPIEFYEEFHVIILGLDSLEARRYMNQIACSLLGASLHCWLQFLLHSPTLTPTHSDSFRFLTAYDTDGKPDIATIKPLVDGGTEGFKGHARVIIPGVTPCFECTLWLFPPQVKFPLCTLAETPRCCHSAILSCVCAIIHNTIQVCQPMLGTHWACPYLPASSHPRENSFLLPPDKW